MGIGYLLLYAALAVVALWLVAELLLQNRAPVHWRALALAGFLGVPAGMATGSVVLIGAGAALFAVGQTLVTLSVKRGYAAGWSLRTADGGLPGPLAKVPLLGALTGGAAVATAVAVDRIGTVSAVEETPEPAPADEEPAAVEQTAAFEMQEIAADGVYASAYYEQQQTELLQPVAQPVVQADPYAGAYQGGYDPAQQQSYDQLAQQQQQQWQAQQQPAFAYDQGYGGYQQQPDPYAGYQQQPVDAYGYQQQQYGYEQQQPQQQWQPQPDPLQHDPLQQGIPQQPQYDYGYQQQNTWQQHG
ncbi:hypothetical protein [Kitasatospora sp. NPDC047058]|uniref:hypothetical protein n=1 Tax=Kitasatospora sp. NPDC047058 TaxID=3155620 RepID=UPI00340CF0D4